MRAHYFQHVPFEGPGSIEEWLDAAGYETTATRFYQGESPPEGQEMDLLVVLGGPMSVNDESAYPWLRAEKEFLRQALAAGTPILGICLGSQLLAGALGARVFPNPCREIGWFPVRGIGHGDARAFSFPAAVDVFHWHGETFDLPAGAVPLARSEGCANQAFQIGRSVIGLQFHLETTPESARQLVFHCRNELIPARYVQEETAILGASAEKYRTIHALMDQLLSYLSAK